MSAEKGADTMLMEKESYDPSFSHAPPFERIPQHSSDPQAVIRIINEGVSGSAPYMYDFSSFGGRRTDDGRYDELFSPGGSLANIAAGSERYNAVVLKCLDMIAGLWHLPQEKGRSGSGVPCFSGEQAAVMAVLAAWRRWRNEKTGNIAIPNIVVTASGNPVWRCFPEMFGIDVRWASDPGELGTLCDKNTVMMIGTVGSIPTSADDDIRELSQRLEELSLERDLHIPLHVDATTTGFVKPFTEPRFKWDFRLPNVASISASVDYAGFTSVPLGWILWRDEEDALCPVKNGLFSGDYGQFLSPLPVRETVCHFYDMIRFGCDGHRAFQYERVNTACVVRDALAEIPQIYVFGEGSRAPFIVFMKDITRSKNSWTIENLWKALAHKGWGTALTELPPGYGSGNAIRLVMHHDTGVRATDLFLSDLRDIISRYEG